MRTIRYSAQFKKDTKLMVKRGKEMKKLRMVIERLVNQEELEERYKDHPLQGDYAGGRRSTSRKFLETGC